MQDFGKTPPTTQEQATNYVVPGQSVTGQAAQGRNNAAQSPGFRQVQQQIADLRQTLQTLMMDKQYADGEIVTATATLDAQLEDYYRTLSDKKQPGMRTF